MFRPFRRSGPTPFQVMSSSWRGPTRPSAQPAAPPPPAVEPPVRSVAPVAVQERDRTEMRAPIDTATVVPSAIQMPTGPLKVKEVEKKQPKATIEVRRHTDPPVAKRQPISARISGAVMQSATALGSITLKTLDILKDRSLRMAKRWGLAGDRKRSHANGLPRQTVVLGFAALALVIVVVAWALRDRDGNALPQLSQQNEVSAKDANLAALLPQPQSGGMPGQSNPESGVQPPVRSAPPVTPPDTSPRPPEVVPQPKPKLSRTSVDPREKGQRYYILATYSVNKEEYLLPLLEYLWSQGVEAGAINGHNSGFFQVIALQGFTRDEINSKAHKQYEESLRRLGRKWKAQGGGDDLQGLYLQEYSGTQAKLSIMKAN